MSRPSRSPALAAALVAALASGCMTIQTRRDPTYDGPRVYSGTRQSAILAGDRFYSLNIPMFLIHALDIPFSFVADTFLLPVTIPEEGERQDTLAAKLTTSDERPSVITPRPGEDAEKLARRFFETCESHLHRWEEALADCYSIHARVEVTRGGQTRTFDGSEYKSRVRDQLRSLRYAGEYVDFEDPSFELLGDGRVRIRSRRVGGSHAAAAPIDWIVGPCADGGWRIVEQVGGSLEIDD